MSRNQREGYYAGKRRGAHSRYGTGTGFKRLPLQARYRPRWNMMEIGRVEGFRYIDTTTIALVFSMS